MGMIAHSLAIGLGMILVGLDAFDVTPSRQERKIWPGCRKKPMYESFAGGHRWDENWDWGAKMVKDTEACIPLVSVVERLARHPREPQMLLLSQICHKPMHIGSNKGLDDLKAEYCSEAVDVSDDLEQRRFAGACPLIPGIVAEGAQNPCGAPFRLVDGVHRLCVLKRTRPGVKYAWFFVLSALEALDMIQAPCPGKESLPKAKRMGDVLRQASSKKTSVGGSNLLASLTIEGARRFIAASRQRTLFLPDEVFLDVNRSHEL